MDSHVHAVDASMYEYDHEIPTMETIADVLRYIRSRAAVVPKGEWISLSQVFITRLREQRYPTRHGIRLGRAGPCGRLRDRARRLPEHLWPLRTQESLVQRSLPPDQAGKVELIRKRENRPVSYAARRTSLKSRTGERSPQSRAIGPL